MKVYVDVTYEEASGHTGHFYGVVFHPVGGGILVDVAPASAVLIPWHRIIEVIGSRQEMHQLFGQPKEEVR